MFCKNNERQLSACHHDANMKYQTILIRMRCFSMLFVFRDAPIDRPVIRIGWFFAWRPGSVTGRVSLSSCRYRADPFIATIFQRRRQTSQSHAHSVACKHIVSCENAINVIMYLCRASLPDEACTVEVSVRETQSTSQKCIDAYCGRKIHVFERIEWVNDSVAHS